MSNLADEGELEPELTPGTSLRTSLVNWAGALTSIVFFLGMGVWGYRLMVRDVTEIPVIKAASADWKKRPDDPGGKIVQNEDAAVHQVPSGGVAGAADGQADPAAKPQGAEDHKIAIAVVPKPLPRPAQTPPGQTSPGPKAENPGAKPAQPQAGENSEGGSELAVLTSIRPMPRPERPKVQIVNSIIIPDHAQVKTEAKESFGHLAEIKAGTWVVQIGDFNSESNALVALDFINSQNDGILAGSGKVVQPVLSPESNKVRLRVTGFEGESDTQRTCDALLKTTDVHCQSFKVVR